MRTVAEYVAKVAEFKAHNESYFRRVMTALGRKAIGDNLNSLFMGLAICAVVYALIQYVTVVTLGTRISDYPLADTASVLLGSFGVQLVEDAVAHARHGGNAHSLAWALGAAAHVLQNHHERAATLRFASEAIELAQEHRLPQWLAMAERCRGWAMHRLGAFQAGMDLAQQGVKRWKDTGAMLHTTHGELILAELWLREGQTEAMQFHLDAARAPLDAARAPVWFRHHFPTLTDGPFWYGRCAKKCLHIVAI